MKQIRKPKKRPIRHHVCIPLYRGIPKELQTGWVTMGDHQVEEWDNTTNLIPFLTLNPKLDRTIYCGTCGRIMVKGRNRTIDKSATAKRIQLSDAPTGGPIGPRRIKSPKILLPK